MDDYEYQRQERRKLQAECSMPSDIGVLDIPMNVTDKEIKIAQLLKKDAETILNIAFASYQPMYFTKQGFQYCIRIEVDDGKLIDVSGKYHNNRIAKVKAKWITNGSDEMELF